MKFYQRKNTQNQLTAIAMTGIIFMGVGCSASGEKEDTDSKSTAGTVYEPGSTAKAEGSSIAGGALNLSAMPNFDDALSSSTSSLALTASGTPPNFVDIKKDNLETYLSSSVATIVTDIEAAIAAKNWDTVDSLIKKFHSGQSKCRIMEQAARQIEDLSRLTSSACMMKEIDKPTGTLLQYVSGNESITAGGFFAVPAGTSAASPIIREITFEPPAKASEPPAEKSTSDKSTSEEKKKSNLAILEEKSHGGPQQIRFKISNENNLYRVQLVFCKSGIAIGSDTIEINSNSGSEGMIFKNFHSGTETRNGSEETFSFSAEMKAGVTSTTDESGNPALEFDATKPKTLNLAGSFSNDKSVNSFNGQLSIADGILSTRYLSEGTFTNNGQTFSNSIKGFSSISFAGKNAAEVKIYEGAGRSTGTFKDPSRSQSDTFDENIGFEYNESATPRYATTTSSSFLTTVTGLDFSTDALLSGSAPVAPASDGSFSDSDCSGSVEDGTVDAVFAFTPSEASITTVETACKNRFDGGSEICRTLQDSEKKIFDAIRSKKQAGK